MNSENLLDVSEHNFECVGHGKKSNLFCAAKDCEQRLFCFTCLKSQSHPHGLEYFANITELFQVKAENSSLDTSQIKELAAAAIKISQDSQKKLKAMTEIFKKIEIAFAEPGTLVELDINSSVHNLLHNSKRAMKEEYEKLNFDTTIVDGPQINGLIKFFLKLKDKVELHNQKCKPEHLEQTLNEIADGIDKLSSKFEIVSRFLINKVSIAEFESNNWQVVPQNIGFLNSIDQKTDAKTVENSQPDIVEEPSLTQKSASEDTSIIIKEEIKAETPKQDQSKIIQQSKKTKMLEPTIVNGSPSKKNVPQLETLIVKSKNPQRPLPQDSSKEPTNNKTNGQNKKSLQEPEITNCRSFFQVKSPLFNREFVLKRMAFFLEQNKFKPTLDDLSNFIGEAAGEFGFDVSQLEFRKLDKLVKHGKNLYKNYQEVLEFQEKVGADFINEISDMLSDLFAKRGGQYLGLKKMNAELQIIQNLLKHHIENKMKTKEGILTMIKELSESKFDFRKEIKTLHELIKVSEERIDCLVEELETCRNDGKKVKLSFWNKKALELFELPFRTKKSYQLMHKLLGLQRSKCQLVNLLTKYNARFGGKKTNQKESLEYKSLAEMVNGNAYTKYDFEIEAKEVLEQFESDRPNDAGNSLIENLPREPQRKTIKAGEENTKSTSFYKGNNEGLTSSNEIQEKNPLGAESSQGDSNQNSNTFTSSSQTLSSVGLVKNTFKNATAEVSSLNITAAMDPTAYKLFLNNQQLYSEENKSPSNPFLMNILSDKSRNQSENPGIVKKIKGNNGAPIL